MERESACHLVKALRLSFDSPEAADELEEFIIDLLERVDFAAKPTPLVRNTVNGVLDAQQPVDMTPKVMFTSDDVIGETVTRAIPITDN